MMHRLDILIARSFGILCIAAGFILGMHGLDDPGSWGLPTALGLIATGLLAQVYALVRSLAQAVGGSKQETNKPHT